MSRVMEAWEQLLRDAVASDYDEQQRALFQIGLVLQRHNRAITPESDMQEEHLERELLRLTLNEQRQRDTLTYLATLVRNKAASAAPLLFAMSNAQPQLLAEPLVGLMHSASDKWNIEASYQALLALEAVLKQAPNELKRALLKHNIRPLLDNWAEADDELLADKADLLFVRLNRLLENG